MGVEVLPDGHYAANNIADIEKLTDMMKELLDKVWTPGWGTFSSEAPTTPDTPESTGLPHITYNLVRRMPADRKTVKWTQFDSFPDPEHDGHNITMYKQWFDCEMDFVIHAATRKEATRLAQKLEEFINTYVGYFKENGIQEMVFQSESAPKTESLSRQDVATRTLGYLVRIERISIVRSIHVRTIGSSIGITNGTDLVSPSTDSSFTPKESTDFLSIYNQYYPNQSS